MEEGPFPILPKWIKKPNNRLGRFYDKQIFVKLKKDKPLDPNSYDLEYFKDCGYCDYRVGCSICEKGDATSFKTNLLDIIKDDYFLLNDLDIILEFDEDEHRSYPLYYQTYDKETIRTIFEHFKTFNKLAEEYHGHNPNHDITDDIGGAPGITSIFRDSGKYYDEYAFVDINTIRCAHICDCCFKWLICINKDLGQNFTTVNSLKIYWADTVNEELEHIIEFKDPSDRELFVISK